MYQPSLGTHFNARFDVETLHDIRAFGFRWARMDAQTCDAETLRGMIEDAEAADLVPFPIVYDLDRLRTVPTGCACEWGNEPDGDILPSTYRANLDAACALAAELGVTLWAPALSNLDRDSLRWLDAVRGDGWPADLTGITVHRYGNGTFAWAHDGFDSREAEVEHLLTLCDGLPLMVTEFGYPSTPTATIRRTARRTRFLAPDLFLSEDIAAAHIAQEWAFWRPYTAVPFLYQINDPPNPEDGCYGIRRCALDGTLTDWKPAAYQVPQEGESAMIAITNATLFGPFPITGWLTADLEGNAVKLAKPLEGGPYLSIQPGAQYEGRPSGGGVYETFTKSGSDLICSYTHEGAEYVHVVPFKELP